MFGEDISDRDLLLLLVGSVGMIDDVLRLHHLDMIKAGQLLLG